MNELIEQARELGYTVEPVREGSETFLVTGFGIMTYYEEDNDEAWELLINNHKQRTSE